MDFSNQGGSSSSQDTPSHINILQNKDINVKEQMIVGVTVYGNLYVGEWMNTPACIQICSSKTDQTKINQFWQEADILSSCAYQHIVSIFGVVNEPGENLKMVTEFVTGFSFRHYLRKQCRPLTRKQRLKIAWDAAKAVNFLHKKGRALFDFKYTNLLISGLNDDDDDDDADPTCKIGDISMFGPDRRPGIEESLPWTAPELLNARNYDVCDKKKADIFAFAIVMWELLTGRNPYMGLDGPHILAGITTNKLRPAICFDDPEWGALIQKCWAHEPKNRPKSFAEVVSRLEAMWRSAA